MTSYQPSQNLVGSKLNAEYQMPFNPDEMAIKRKLFALPI